MTEIGIWRKEDEVVKSEEMVRWFVEMGRQSNAGRLGCWLTVAEHHGQPGGAAPFPCHSCPAALFLVRQPSCIVMIIILFRDQVLSNYLQHIYLL